MPLAKDRGILNKKQLPDDVLSILATGDQTIRELFEDGTIEGAPADYDLTGFTVQTLGGLRVNSHSPLASLADKTKTPVPEHIHQAVVSGQTTVTAALGLRMHNYDLSPYTDSQIGAKNDYLG